MKKKFEWLGFKLKVSWKKNRFFSIYNSFKTIKTTNKFVLKELDVNTLFERKLYRIFKEEYCEFFPGKVYGPNGTQPSSYIYYKRKENNGKKYLIGEFMFGELITEFFKRKNILIEENIKEYKIVQGELTLASYDKEWIESQQIYR